MFSAAGLEVSYRIILLMLKGVTSKLLDNYALSDDLIYYKWLGDQRIPRKKILKLKKVMSRLHRYLNSLGSKKKPPKYTTLCKYLNLCRDTKAVLCLEGMCLHFTTSLWYVLSSYEQILTKMVSGSKANYPEIFTSISKNLIITTIHHEAFLNKVSSFADQLNNTKKTFDILLR